jgi:molybdopterin-guanine dinucleotide biosynthesis protein
MAKFIGNRFAMRDNDIYTVKMAPADGEITRQLTDTWRSADLARGDQLIAVMAF